MYINSAIKNRPYVYLHAESVPDDLRWTANTSAREFVGRFVFKESSIGSCVFWQRSIIESQLPVQLIRCIHYSPSILFFFSRILSYFRQFRVITFGNYATSSLKRNRPYISRESRNRERKHSVYTYNLPT